MLHCLFLFLFLEFPNLLACEFLQVGAWTWGVGLDNSCFTLKTAVRHPSLRRKATAFVQVRYGTVKTISDIGILWSSCPSEYLTSWDLNGKSWTGHRSEVLRLSQCQNRPRLYPMPVGYQSTSSTLKAQAANCSWRPQSTEKNLGWQIAPTRKDPSKTDRPDLRPKSTQVHAFTSIGWIDMVSAMSLQLQCGPEAAGLDFARDKGAQITNLSIDVGNWDFRSTWTWEC